MLSSAKTSELLDEREIHIWHALLDTSSEDLLALQMSLDNEERNKARRLVFDSDRKYFIASHGILKSVLGVYLEKHPEHIRLTQNRFGKPALLNGHRKLVFNISHSANRMVLALGVRRDVGVDLEFVNTLVTPMSIAPYFFTAEEVADLRRLHRDTQLRTFYQFWTRKEAFVKSTGFGLSFPLESINVAYPSSGNGRRIHAVWMSETYRRWVYDFWIEDMYIGALATSQPASLVHFQLGTFRELERQSSESAFEIIQKQMKKRSII